MNAGEGPSRESSTRRFGYSVVAAAFSVQAIAVGLSVSLYPVFMESIEREFGTSRGVASLGIPSLLLFGALISPWIGRRVDRGSPRRLMVAGALLMTAGLGGLSAATNFVAAALLWIVVVGAGQAMLGALPAMTVLANWFVARRGTVIAVAAMGTTLGGALAPPLSELLIRELGWRTSLVWLAAAVSLLGIPIVLLGIVKRPEDVGAHPDGAAGPPALESAPAGGDSLGEILAERRFWLVGAAFALMNGVGISFLTHLIFIAQERGVTREQAVFVLTLNAISTACGKVAFGQLTDRLGVRRAAQIAAALCCLGWLGVLFADGTALFVVSAALFTFPMGCVMPCGAAFIAALYGLERFGRASGVLGLVQMVGALALPPLVGLLFDASGGYGPALQLMAAAIALPLLLFSLVRV